VSRPTTLPGPWAQLAFAFDEHYNMRDVLLAVRDRLTVLARENVALAVKVREMESTLRSIQ